MNSPESRSPNRRQRRGATLIELLVSLLAGSVLFVTFLEFHQKGLRTMESDHRKTSAIRRTHLEVETFRHHWFSARWTWLANLKDLEQARQGGDLWASAPSWITGVKSGDKEDGPIPATTPLIYMGRPTAGRPDEGSTITEYFFDKGERGLYVGGQLFRKEISDMRFDYGTSPSVIKLSVSCDEHLDNIPTNATRERSTLLSAVFCQAQDESIRFRSHVHDRLHRWCVMAMPIHAGYTDDPKE